MGEVTCNFYMEHPEPDCCASLPSLHTIYNLDSPATEDTFGLEFAVSQWLKLVTNAESLFSKLVTSKFITNEEKNQIERWLCLKQECEECVGSDDTQSVAVGGTQALERIDELSESDFKTDKSSDMDGLSSNASEDIETETDSETDLDQHPDFVERLDVCIRKLKYRTDEIVEVKKAVLSSLTNNEAILNKQNKGRNPPTHHSLIPNSCLRDGSRSERRKSIHPGLGVDILRTAKVIKFEDTEGNDIKVPFTPVDIHINGEIEKACNTEISKQKLVSLVSYVGLKPITEPCEELKILSAGNEAKQSQMCQVLIDLEGAQRRIEELQRTIQLKEQFIENMVKNDKMRATAKQRFKRKRIKLESEYYRTRSQLAEAEDSLMVARENNIKEHKQKYEKEIEKFKCEAILYEKRLKTIEVMKQIAENSARKMLELENSLQKSKSQMDKLKKQLKKEEEQKHILEQELLQDQYKIKELEEKYSIQLTKEDQNPCKNAEESRLRWIQEEEERVLSLRESSQRFQEQLVQKQIMLERREAFLKQRLCLEKTKTNNISEVSARISHLHQVLKDKSSDTDKVEYADEKEALRHEIGNLRRTRDCLVDQRCNLDEKYQKEKSLSNVDERRLIECEEAIEAIDAAIEYKNELICGRNCADLHSSEIPREKGEELLLARLMKLSSMELRSLLYKYFQKVIDLRENGKKMEIQLTELDIQNESQKWQIQALSNALEQARLKAERHIVMLQKEHEEEMALMLRYFAEESSGSSGAEVCHRAGSGRKGASKGHVPYLPGSGWEELQGPLPTKVTKERNRLVIQQHKTKKLPKR